MISRWKKSGKKSVAHSRLNEILSTAISSDGKYCAAGGRDKMIHIFDLRSNTEVKVFDGHRDTVTSLCFRNDSYSLFSGSSDRCVKHWDLNEMGYLETLFGHQEGITSLDCWKKNNPITASSDSTLRLWNTTSDSHLVFRGLKYGVDTVQYLNDEMFISGSQNGTLAVWKETIKKCLNSVVGAHGYELGVSNNCRSIVSIGTFKNSDMFISGSYDGNKSKYFYIFNVS